MLSRGEEHVGNIWAVVGAERPYSRGPGPQIRMTVRGVEAAAIGLSPPRWLVMKTVAD